LLVAVIGQQVSVRAAQSIRYRLMENLGTQIIVSDSREEERYGLYPSPQQLIEAGEKGLRAQGLSRQKAAYLLGIARRAAEGELDWLAWARLPDEKALKRLCEIKGVGRWTAPIFSRPGTWGCRRPCRNCGACRRDPRRRPPVKSPNDGPAGAVTPRFTCG